MALGLAAPVAAAAPALRLDASLHPSRAAGSPESAPAPAPRLALRLDPALDTPAADAGAFRPLPAGLEEMIVSLRVNGIDHGELDVFMTPSNDFLVPARALAEWIRIPAAAPRAELGGETLIFLGGLRGGRVDFDEATLALRVQLPPEYFAPQVFTYRSGERADVTPSPDLSALLTYSVGGSAISGGGTEWSFTSEADVAYRGWLLRNQYFRYDLGDRASSLRGLTQVVKDDPRALTRFIAGDFFATPTELTGGTILGGLGYSRSFDIDPYFVRTPAAAFQGVADLPSDVDFFVGNNRIYHQRVAPGPFAIDNVSYLTGQRDVRIVVHDAAGHESTIAFPFYFADQGLRAGLQDFSYQVGAIRENAALRSADYGDAAFSATHRIGVNDHVTAGFHAEGTKALGNAGPSLILRSDRLGVLSAAFLASRDRDSGSGGHAASFGYTYQRGHFSAVLGVHRASPGFAFVHTRDARPLALRDETMGVAYGGEDLGTLSASYRRIVPADEPASRVAGVSYSLPLSRQWLLRAGYRKTSGFGAGSQFDLAVQYLPRHDVTASAAYHSDDAGTRTTSLEIGNIVPEGEGLGYHAGVSHTTGPGGRLDTVTPGIVYRMRPGVLQADATSTWSPSLGQAGVYNLSWSGSVAYVGGQLGLSRPIDDSFAVVRIEPPLGGVRVYLNQQEMGRTDAQGRLFLPRLVSYVENYVGIEDKDIPIEYGIARKSQLRVPQLRTGSAIVFNVTKITAVTGTLRYGRGGRSVPLASAVLGLDVAGKRVEVPTGNNGEFYIEDLPAGDYAAEVEVEGRSCRFTLSVPARDEPVVTLEDIHACDVP